MSRHREPRLAGSQPRIFFSAGEISGDFQAAHLARAIRRANPGARLYGCGGERMSAAGVDIRLPTAHLGYVGLEESLPFLGEIRGMHRRLAGMFQQDRPDLAVLVDGERFNGPLMSVLVRERIPFVYYFVPQVWFWGRWRTRRIARAAQLVIPAFPAERDIFRAKGARVEWLGHPLLDIVTTGGDTEQWLRDAGLDPSRPLVGLMPGSRRQEVESFTPTLLASARELRRRRPTLQFILPLAAGHLRSSIEQSIAEAGLGDAVRIVPGSCYPLLGRCEVVLLASGTATLELALLGVPMVVCYRVRPATYLAARAVVRTRFIAMPNILLDAPVVPELVQSEFTAGRVTAEAAALLDDPARTAAVRRQLARIPVLLGGTGVLDRAAAVILGQLHGVPAPAVPGRIPALATA